MSMLQAKAGVTFVYMSLSVDLFLCNCVKITFLFVLTLVNKGNNQFSFFFVIECALVGWQRWLMIISDNNTYPIVLLQICEMQPSPWQNKAGQEKNLSEEEDTKPNLQWSPRGENTSPISF